MHPSPCHFSHSPSMAPLSEDTELISPDSGSSAKGVPVATESPDSLLEEKYLEDQRAQEQTFFTPNQTSEKKGREPSWASPKDDFKTPEQTRSAFSPEAEMP